MIKSIEIPFSPEEVELELARKDFYTFAKMTAEFEWKDNWHLEYIATKLEKVAKGEIKRLILTIPFRHGKSQLASRALPAYYLGNHPNDRIIGTSHSSTLAKSMSRDAKRVIQSEIYRKIFPETSLNPKKVASDSRYKSINTSDQWDIINHRGGYLAKGAGQAIQGTGASLIIVDDVYGNREDAYSETMRRRIENWFDQDVKSRLDKGGSMVVVNTRMHHADLIAYLGDTYPGEWETINFPAIKENDEDPDDPRGIGEPLWPWRMSSEELLAIKKSRPDIYYGSYQGVPSPPGGTLLKKEGIQYFSVHDLDLNEATIIQSWDLRHGGKGKNTSFAVGQLWAMIGANAYMLDQCRGKWDSTETLNIIKAKAEDPLWSRARAKLIEAKADGKTLIPMLKQHVPGILPIEPKGSKEGRVMAIQPYWSALNIFIPNTGWAPAFEIEALRFPTGKNDDQVDAMSQALNYLYNGIYSNKSKPQTIGSANNRGRIQGGW